MLLVVKTQNVTVLGGDTYFKERPIVSSSSENFTLKSGQDSVFPKVLMWKLRSSVNLILTV